MQIQISIDEAATPPYCSRLKVQKTPKRHPKIYLFFLFKCCALDFVVRTWAIDTCVLDFVGLGISKTMRRKKPVWNKPFSHGLFCHFCGAKKCWKTTCTFRFLSMRLLPPKILVFSPFSHVFWISFSQKFPENIFKSTTSLAREWNFKAETRQCEKETVKQIQPTASQKPEFLHNPLVNFDDF